MTRPYGIHWFRRDLRIQGNQGFLKNSELNEGRTVGVFFFDSKFLSRKDFSHHRFQFFLDTLAKLKDELRKKGSDLLVMDGGPDAGFSELLKTLSKGKTGKPSLISYNRDYEPFARERDARVRELLETEHGVKTFSEKDHLVIEPLELVRSGSSSFYQIYSAFARRWLEKFKEQEIQNSIRDAYADCGTSALTWTDLLQGTKGLDDAFARFNDENRPHVTVDIPHSGSQEAIKALHSFQEKISTYEERRDFPSEDGTSRMSLFLKNGSITSLQIISTLKLNPVDTLTSSQLKYLKELIWREFYYHLLWHSPRVEHEAFQTKFKNIRWENRTDFFEAWKNGETGYGIVDAAMRELKQTGKMHNRLRMIVASFLTKDLLIDWRWGENHFMKHLLDGDLAPNNGGWQWAASTGCDPQPYFRIFNPILQSQKFDPSGDYLKRWLPERTSLQEKAIHEPIQPIVDHATQKSRCLKLYQSA